MLSEQLIAPSIVDRLVPRYTPPAPANDNHPVMVGLTGKRNVGKSTVADLLEVEFGFVKVHAFESGKVAAYAYFKHAMRHLPDAEDIARRMVWGDLKDKPSEHLPGFASPRYYMERSGHFHGVDLGTEWTLGMELRAVSALNGDAPIIVESVVYESPWFRSAGGIVVRVVRPGFVGPEGHKSDEAQAGLAEDMTLVNDGGISELEHKTRELAADLLA